MSLQNESLQLSLPGDAALEHRVEPLVIMSILDHYKRRNNKQERVIGTLLGQRCGDRVVIRSCFPDLHKEQGDQIVIDVDYHASMAVLHARVSPSDVVLGWYSTGGVGALAPTSVTVSSVFASYTNGAAPLLLTVDTALDNSRLGIKAYAASSLSAVADKAPILAVFDELRLELFAPDEDRIGVDALIQSHPDDDTFDSSATLLSDQRGLMISLESLHGMLADVVEYADRVLAGEIEPSATIGRILADAVAAVPQFDAKFFEQSFNDRISDVLGVSYLASLTRAQLAIADKVNLIA